MTEQHQATATVRPRETADLDPCAAALAEVYATDGYPVEGVADALRWLVPTGLLAAWVAELSDEVVGHVAISSPQPGDDAVAVWRERSGDPAVTLAVLGRLFVLSTARGHSLGEQLVRAATVDAERRGVRLVLDVMAKDRAATRLYERLGWQRIGTATHTFGSSKQVPAYCYVAPEPPQQSRPALPD